MSIDIGDFLEAAQASGLTAKAARGLAEARIPRLKPGSRAIASLGHSFIANSFLNNASLAAKVNVGAVHWAAFFSHQRVRADASLSFSAVGDTIAQTRARVPAVVASGAEIVYLCTGTNNLTPSPTTLEAMVEDYDAILDELTAGGLVVICDPIMPRLTWTGLDASGTAAAIRKAEAFNRWLFDRCASQGNLYALDCLDVWTDLSVNSAWRPPGGTTPGSNSFTGDGLHPSILGAYVTGRRLGELLTALYPAHPKLWNPYLSIFHAAENPNGNFISNPLMITTVGGFAGTGVTGTVAGGWQASRNGGFSNLTATASIVTASVGFGQSVSKQQFVINNPGSGIEAMSFRQEITLSGQYTPGGAASPRSSIDIEVDAPSARSVVGLEHTLQEANSGGSVLFTAYDLATFSTPSTAPILPAEAISGRFTTPGVVSNAAATKLTARTNIYVAPGQSVTVRFTNADVSV